MNKIKMVVGLVVVLFCLLGSVGYAKGELTLEELAKRVDTLFADLDDRISELESVQYPHRANGYGEIACILTSSYNDVQRSTIAKYMEAFPGKDLPEVYLKGAWVLTDNTTVFRFKEGYPSDLFVEEYWNGCEFLGSSDWWPEKK